MKLIPLGMYVLNALLRAGHDRGRAVAFNWDIAGFILHIKGFWVTYKIKKIPNVLLECFQFEVKCCQWNLKNRTNEMLSVG